MKPRISVVLPCYNHGKYVGECLRAFATQTFQDFELIVIDDASTDDSVARIRGHNDQRILFVARCDNRGIAAGINEGVTMAKADIVCLFATDDMPDPDYLAEVMRLFEQTPSAIAAYFPLRQVREDGQPMQGGRHFPQAADRFNILRSSFLEGNPLPSPGMAIRRTAALKARLPEGVCQYSDWMLNNRLLLLGEVALGEKPLLSYRVSLSSLSARSPGSMARDRLETRIMMDDFLKIRDMSVLARMFPDEIAPYAKLPPSQFAYVLGRMALLSPVAEKRAWGYETIMRHISDPINAESLRQLIGFTYKDLMALTPTDSAKLLLELGELKVAKRRLRRRVLRLSIAVGVFSSGLVAAIWMLLR